MGSRAAAIELHDLEPERETFLREALAGLRQKPKRLPCKYFYDARGSELFEAICELEAYYPTRTELEIMREHGGEMARALGQGCLLVEYGSGSSLKTRILLDHLEAPAGYVPVDISRDHLEATARGLAAEYPELDILPVCADFTQPFDLPRPRGRVARRAVYFPGSTIGNFTRDAAVALLRGVARTCGAGGRLLIGADLEKDRDTLERAYDDPEGVTAAFNRNILERINRELGGDFELEDFSHRALWVPEAGRVEMHLVSRVDQVAHLDGEPVEFHAGEAICTEHSHKYTLDGFGRLAGAAGFAVERVWTDPRRWFSVQLLRVTACPSTSPTART